MTLPIADILAILPELIVVTTACLVLALDPVIGPSRKNLLAWLSLGSLVLCFGLTYSQMDARVTAFSDLLRLDSERYGLRVGQAAWRLGVSVREYRELEAGARPVEPDRLGRSGHEHLLLALCERDDGHARLSAAAGRRG